MRLHGSEKTRRVCNRRSHTRLKCTFRGTTRGVAFKLRILFAAPMRCSSSSVWFSLLLRAYACAQIAHIVLKANVHAKMHWAAAPRPWAVLWVVPMRWLVQLKPKRQTGAFISTSSYSSNGCTRRNRGRLQYPG